ncbi:MAG: ClpXP protease specificity-enhancing factor SspB [Candidatus Tectomicrobia bacterium]|nr:ClpXP protease specificity-enhancing factor SspB [Candidatus Tectomicrobia bacterium]
MDLTPASKEAVVLKLLAEGDTLLCLDARHPDACVPPHQAGNPALRLILNRQFPRPIDVSEDGIGVNLSFGGRRFDCYIPMDALWAAFNPHTMEGSLWQESASPEVLEGLKVQMKEKRDTEATAGPDRSGPTAVPRTNGEAPASASPRKRGHLRLVK